jgi:hypothetical protein
VKVYICYHDDDDIPFCRPSPSSCHLLSLHSFFCGNNCERCSIEESHSTQDGSYSVRRVVVVVE